MESGRHPFEFVALVGAIIIGATSALGSIWPEEIQQDIPRWFDIMWGFLFTFGAVLALIGTRMKKRSVGIGIEQVGLACLGTTCFVCAFSLLVISKGDAAPAIFLFTMLGIACAMQWCKLQMLVHKVINNGRVLSKEK